MKKKHSLLYENVLDAVNRNLLLPQFLVEMERLRVFVVKPGDIVNSVYYRNESRFFVHLDEDNTVIGGYFA